MTVTYGPEPTTTFPQAFGTLTARPAWTNATAAAGPGDQPAASTRTRTLNLPNAPAAGGDILAAWVAYFGNRTGNAGTKQAGDRVIIPGYAMTYSDNLDIPPACNDIEVVFGTEGNQTILRSSQMTQTSNPDQGVLVTQHAIRNFGTNIRLRGVSKTTPAVIETTAVVGRNGLNQQGNTCLLLDPGSSDTYVQDMILRGARAAGFFAYTSTRYWLNRVTVEDSLADAFHNTQGSTYGTFTDCVSRRCGDDGMAIVYYDGNAIDGQSHHIEVYRHIVDGNGHGRGFANICCTDVYADQVIIRGSAAASVIIDREASATGSAHGSIARTLLQRFYIEGGNWSEQDHGSVFLNNGRTNGTVDTTVLESFEIRDAAPNRQVVRVIGDGTTATVLDVTMTDFRFSGGTTTVASDQYGGNNTSRITRNGWANINIVAGQDQVAPTVVINVPGRGATVKGVMTGSTTDTSAMRNTQAIQFYAGDAGAKVSGTNQIGVATVQVKVGDTVLGTIAGSALDSAKRGSQVWDTTQFTNGPARITLLATDMQGRTKTVTRDVTVSNTTAGTTAGMPAGATTEPTNPTPGATVARVIDRWTGTDLVREGPTSTGTVSDASTTTKGVVQLAGALGGTAASPTALGLASSAELAEFARDTIGATLVAGSNITVTVNDAADTITIASTAAASTTQYGTKRTMTADRTCLATQITPLVMNANVFDVGGYTTKVDASATNGAVVKTAGIHFVAVAAQLVTSTGSTVNGSQTSSTGTGSFVIYVNGASVAEVGVPRNNDYRPNHGGVPLNLAVGDEVTVSLYVSADTVVKSGGPNTSLSVVRA